jgi:hypothetical protein
MQVINVSGKVYLKTGHEGPQGSRGSAPSTLALDGGGGGQRQALTTLPPGKTQYTLYMSLGRPQRLLGRARKISPPSGIRSPDRPARSKSLYRLSHPGTL